jgi:hypothetical protein
MPKIRHHRSSRRAPPLKDTDYDHKIYLVDRDDEERSPPPSSAGPSSSHPTADPGVHVGAEGERGPREEEGTVEGGPPKQPSVLVEGE